MNIAIMAVAASLAGGHPGESNQIVQRTQAFLAAYAKNDIERVVAMTDTRDLAIYGSDLAEFCATRSCLRAMMSSDFNLWGTARFGSMKNVTVRSDGRLASIVFNVPFAVGGRAEMPVRVSMVWRRSQGQWRLSQSSNVVPTVGSTAADILAKQRPTP